MDYEKMLKIGKEKLPKLKVNGERFEIPLVKGHVEGNKTIVINFIPICNELHREPEQVLKYLQRELATPAEIDPPRLLLKRKLHSDLINQKLGQYARDFVICKECGKPDTKLRKEGRVLIMKCFACGAKHPIKSKI